MARRAGVSGGLPYRYFGTRSGLLIALVDDFYRRLETAALLHSYDAPTWAGREKQRIGDWIDFLYAEPLAPMVLGGPAGDAEVVAANAAMLARMAELGARNIANAQKARELPVDRDPQMLAAGLLSGVHAIASVALGRTPRPPAARVGQQVWAFLSGAVGLPPEKKHWR